ncbi:ubiquitin-protein ligase E3C-like [Oppia nitens]|uniref:ubiquitin-protein ligase E3C-like n=1 Tax=Oppia nitens TaxID=1686743 RepID=UPI0023DC1F18|nr:ubiquitin-protein ligase E3C-like [Oppia nitens]
MANIAKGFFDGNFRRTPQQSLGGHIQNPQREQLLQRLAEERHQREQLRRQTNSAIVIQSFVRACLERKQLFSLLRKEFDHKIDVMIKRNSSPTVEDMDQLILKFIIFFNETKDSQRLNWLTQQLVRLKDFITIKVLTDENQWLYRIKCILEFNIRYLESIADNQTSIAIPMRVFEVYTSVDSYNSDNKSKVISTLTSIWDYLICHNFFTHMRHLIDSKIPEPYESTSKAPTPLAATLLELTLRPLKTLKENNETKLNFVIKRFLTDILKGSLTPQIKDYVLTYLSQSNDITAEDIIDCLLADPSCDNIAIIIESNIWLFFSVLKLIGVQSKRFNTKYVIKYLHILRPLSTSLIQTTCLRTNANLDEEDNEDMDTTDYMSSDGNTDDSSLVDSVITMINEPTHVMVITGLTDLDVFINDSQILISLSYLCHSLLSSHTLAVNQYRMLYTLAFKGRFLRTLWKYITSVSSSSMLGTPTSLLYTISQGLPLASIHWEHILPELTLFCTLFSYLFPTLDDVEFYRDMDSQFEVNDSQSTIPFTLQELASMGSTLRDVCVGLVKLAYDDTRHTVRNDYQELLKNENQTNDSNKDVTRYWMKLFKSCVKLLRQLHSRDARRQYCPPQHWISKQVSIPVERPANFRVGIQQRRTMYQEFMGLRHLSREELETHGPPLSTSEVRNITILQEIPFVVPFLDRFKILQTMINIDRTQHRGDANTFNVMGHSIDVNIRRNYIYEDAFEQLSPENKPNLKPILKVKLVSAIGLDEVGIDGGGIFREFLSEVLKTAFDPNRGFFRTTSDGLLYPNPSVSLIVDNYVKHYFFIGRLLGKAIYENMLVELPFAAFFLAKLLARQTSSDIEIHHLASLDPLMYKNLIFLKNYDGDVTELGLDFTVINSDLGTTQVIELKPNGAKIPVTAQNRIEYIHLMADYRLNKQIRLHCAAFKKGLADVLDLDWLRMFDGRELQILISGAPTPVDVDDLKNHTNYGGGYHKDHVVVITFWNVVEQFDESQKRKLLKFVTSCSRPPLLGFKDLFPPFCIQNAGRESNRLPTASTCMNLLKLPEIEDLETMKQKLKYAVDSGAGFELS